MFDYLTPDQHAWCALKAHLYPPVLVSVPGPLGMETFQLASPPHPGLILMDHPMPPGWKAPAESGQNKPAGSASRSQL
jgi:hypothetical protein